MPHFAPPTWNRSEVNNNPVLTLQDDSFGMVRFVIALRTGAAYDGAGRAGLLRVMMDLLLRGTLRASRREFNSALEELGSAVDMQVGSELAFVRGVALKRHVQRTFSLVTEAILQPAFATGELQRLVEETVEGLQAERDDDDAVADYFLRRALYANHPLAASPAGEVADLQALSVEAVHAAHKMFAAGNVLVAFAGALTPGDGLALARPLLEGLPTQRPALPTLPSWPRPDGLHIVVVNKPDRTQVQLRIATLGLDGRHPDVEALWLGVTAFGGTFTSPFTRAVRDERGWSYVAHADFRRRGVFTAPLVLRSAPALADAVPCLELELQLYEEFAEGRLDAEALALARHYWLNRYPFEIATAFDMLGPAISHEILGMPLDDILTLPQRLTALDLQTVPQVVARHLHPQHVVALLVAPADAVVPDLHSKFPQARVDVVDFRQGLGLNTEP